MKPMRAARTLASAGAAPEGPAPAQDSCDRPSARADPIIVISPSSEDFIDWDKVAGDANVKAVVHRAFFGQSRDTDFVANAAQAKARGLRYGAYLLGGPRDPIRQADVLIALAASTGTRFLALEIALLDPRFSMTLPNAVLFIRRVYAGTGRCPALHVSDSALQEINARYGPDSVFAKTPLWISPSGNEAAIWKGRIWPDYKLRQISSETEGTGSPATSLYRVPGTWPRMHVNIFNGTEAELAALFD